MVISGLVLRPFSLPVPRQKIRIGMITDLHYADRATPQNSSRYYRESLEKLRDCVDEMNREKVDFLIQVGDLKDQDEPPVEARTLEYLETWCRSSIDLTDLLIMCWGIMIMTVFPKSNF